MIDNFKKYLSDLSDENLVFAIQREYNRHVRMFKWTCSSCGKKYFYDDICDPEVGYEEEIRCSCPDQTPLTPDPKEKIYEYYRPGFCTESGQYNSIMFNTLYDRYKHKIGKDCKFYSDEEKGAVTNEITYAYFKAIMNYGKSSVWSSFNTYMWGAIKRRHVDISRRKGWVSKNPNVICLVCGFPTGMISKNHLMNTDSKYGNGAEGYMGHSAFHKHILENRSEIFDPTGKTEKEILKYISQRVVSEYQVMFPSGDISARDVSLDRPGSSDNDSDDYSLMNMISSPEQNLFEEDDVVVYDSYLFPETHLLFMKDRYPYIHEMGMQDKSIHKIGKSYDGYEQRDTMLKMLDEISTLVIKDFCSTEKGHHRREKFYDSTGSIDQDMLKIVSDVIELSLVNNYPNETICSIIGHGNVTLDEVRHWTRTIRENESCQMVASRYY